MRSQLKVDWSIKKTDLEPALKRYRRYIENMGFSKQTIEDRRNLSAIIRELSTLR